MRMRAWSSIVLAVALLLAVALAGGGQDLQAEPSEPAAGSHHAFDPAELQPGRPLPGAGYPWQRVERLAPVGWTPASPPAGVDLDVTFINRTPTYRAYCVQYPGGIPTLCPGTESEQRWPAPGEVVTFTAHVVNKGTDPSPSFAYRWSIDGAQVLAGTHPELAPGAETTVTYAWPWAHVMDGERVVDDHAVAFQVDPDDLIAETYETNNSLEDRTNALGFRLAITPEMYEAYNTPWNPAFSYSAEDWLQRQIVAMNWSFANSTYPTTPSGATERVRINQILVTSVAPINDRTSDGGWFVDGDYRLISGGYDPIADVDWNLVHELSHQVGLIDLYMSGIYATVVQVLDREGGPANIGFAWPRPGLMGGGDIAPHTNHHLYASHSAAGISSTKGYRRGYYGEYQYDIPQQNYIQVLDSQGDPAQDVQVALYQRTGPPVWPGDSTIDNTPEISGTTAPDGRLLLANRSVGGGITTRTGHTLHDNPFGVVDVVGKENIFVIKLSKGDHEEFAWIDVTAFNLAFWAGDTASHTFVLQSHVPPPGAPAAPSAAMAHVEKDTATLCWAPSSSLDVAGYYVYRAAPPIYAYERASGLLGGLCFSEAYGQTRIYAVTAVDGAGRESGFSNFAWAPRLLHPYAVALMSDGSRTVLDPQNGYALLRQRPDGRYLQNIGSVHYHLEISRYLAADGDDRLLLSHPADWYSSRHSVRVADRDASPLLEFGQRGSEPGQFETPAGVVAVGQAPTIEGPYEDDAHTLLLLHFDGSYTGTQGEVGTASGTTFVPGKYGQAVTVDAGDMLTYQAAGNLNRTEGAVEFWLRPFWNGADGTNHTFFEVGDGWFNRMRIMKDGADNLRFIVWDSTAEYGVAYHVAHWQAGDWHHVAATWQGTEIALYVDGLQQDSRDTANVPDILAATIYVGTSMYYDQAANADLDELRISDLPRLGVGEGFPYRFLVADNGNHRVQAFDEFGHFVTAYGSYGSGPEQFAFPEGLAVDDAGRVIVVDGFNNRLQVLSFDGWSFAHLAAITAGFNYPTGVDTAGDRIIVADTQNDRVVVLNAAGSLLASYTAPNDGHAGPFYRPRGVLADGAGNIIVADTMNGRVVTIVGALPAGPKQAVYLPLVLKVIETSPPPPTPTPGPGGCYPQLLAAPGVGRAPHGLAVDTAGARLFVGNHDDVSLSVLDTTTHGLLATVPAGDGPNGVAYDPASGRIYVANRNTGAVTVLRGSDYGLVATVGVGSLPDGLAVNPDTHRVYVANFGSGTVSILDGGSLAVVDTLSVGAQPSMVAVNRTTGKVYVTLHGEGKLAVIDGAGNVTHVDLHSAGPYGLAVDEVRNQIYVAAIDAARIAVVDGADDTLLGWAEIRPPSGADPAPLRMVAVNPEIGASGHLFVTTAGVDGGWNQVLMLPKGWDEGFGEPHALDLAEPREGIAFDPATGRLYVASRAGDLVAAYLDGEPACPGNLPAGEYRLTLSVAGP